MQLFPLLLAFLLPPGAVAEGIIGGHEAKRHSRPYMAFVQFQGKQSPKRCAGVLVRRDFVLTAAHCQGRNIIVTLGAHDISKKESTWQVIDVKKAIPHPDYDSKNFSNDIMLLKLVRKAKMTTAVKPLSLASPRAYVRAGQVCSMAGWGRVTMSTLATRLQEVQLSVQKDQVCETIFQDFYSRNTQICVGDPKKMKGGFKGDSGGPLVCDNTTQGVFIYGRRNGTPPGVFINVSPLLPWIRRTMRRPLQGMGTQFSPVPDHHFWGESENPLDLGSRMVDSN